MLLWRAAAWVEAGDGEEGRGRVERGVEGINYVEMGGRQGAETQLTGNQAVALGRINVSSRQVANSACGR